jgi:hypothetical protein
MQITTLSTIFRAFLKNSMSGDYFFILGNEEKLFRDQRKFYSLTQILFHDVQKSLFKLSLRHILQTKNNFYQSEIVSCLSRCHSRLQQAKLIKDKSYLSNVA